MQKTSEGTGECVYCGEKNVWLRMKPLAVVKRRCRHCSKMNVVWYYKVFVTEPFTGHLDLRKRQKNERPD